MKSVTNCCHAPNTFHNCPNCKYRIKICTSCVKRILGWTEIPGPREFTQKTLEEWK